MKTYKYKHLLIVHGIGDQAPNETALNFMNEFICALPQDDKRKLSVHNLIESVDLLRTTGTAGHTHPFQPANIVYSDETTGTVNVIGFSEVYWQPITNGYIEQNKGLPIPIFTWARSVMNRLSTPGKDFTQWRLAIENLERILQLLKRLSILFKKVGLFNNVTEKFLGDVQMYAESDAIRQEVNEKFFSVVSRVNEFANNAANSIRKDFKHTQQLIQTLGSQLTGKARNKRTLLTHFSDFNAFNEEDIEIYIVAHSEGTVVSYNSLVWAAMAREGIGLHANDDEFNRANEAYQKIRREVSQFDWLPQVAGLVTLGSPLDKHFIIWRNRFIKHLLRKNPDKKITWLNYTDANDPVGYELRALKDSDFENSPTDAERLFHIKDDILFQRYLIPGKAHIDYWSDKAIHARIIELMDLSGEDPPPLNNAWWAKLGLMPIADWAFYFIGRILLLGAGAFIVNRLLHTNIFNWLPSLEFIKNTREIIQSPHIFQSALLNETLWLGTLTLLMNPLIEFEKAKSFEFEWSSWPRYILNVFWLIVATVVSIDLSNAPADSNFAGIIKYLTALIVVILLWKLHTAIHRGLIQLWRYTRVL